MSEGTASPGRAEAPWRMRPRWGRHHALATGCVLGLAGPAIAVAQTSGDTARGAPAVADSVPPAAGNNAPTTADSTSPNRVPAAPGTMWVNPNSPAARSGILPINVSAGQPSDTTLARACKGLPGGSEAPGLLAVIFRGGTSDRDRIAAAKAVGGSLGGQSAHGEEYVKLAVGAGPLTAVADRLIRQDPVVRVAPAPCPPQAIVAPARPGNPPDSARAPAARDSAAPPPPRPPLVQTVPPPPK